MTQTEVDRSLVEHLDVAIDNAVEGLFAVQRADGSWRDTLPSAATATGSCIIALHLADPVGSRQLIDQGAEWLRQAQGGDGGWGEAVGAPSNINSTGISIAALQFVAPERSRDQVRSGQDWLDRHGGIEVLTDLSKSSLGPVCQHYLSLTGLYDEDSMVRIPVELSLFPHFIRRKFCFSMPGLMSWGVMQARLRESGRPRRLINRLAEPRALAFLESVRQFEGDAGGYEESPLMASIVCIGLARAGVADDLVQHCLAYMRSTVRADGSWAVNRDLELTATTHVTCGLQEVRRGGDPRLVATGTWLLGCQLTSGFPPTGCPAGGWGWSRPSGWPGSLDTADALIVLSRFRCRAHEPSIQRGLDWLHAMQNRDGSWSYFCRDSRLPVDTPCAVMTAHVLIALKAAGGLSSAHPAVARALRWFGRVQRPDGAIESAWYTGLAAGTGMSLAALGRLGEHGSPTARRCREWLLGHQNDDGGWGDGTGGPSTVEETAWALLGLADCGPYPVDDTVRLGARWLMEHQDGNGLWRPALVGLYMHDLLFASDHFANGYALQALGRARRRIITGAEE